MLFITTKYIFNNIILPRLFINRSNNSLLGILFFCHLQTSNLNTNNFQIFCLLFIKRHFTVVKPNSHSEKTLSDRLQISTPTIFVILITKWAYVGSSIWGLTWGSIYVEAHLCEKHTFVRDTSHTHLKLYGHRYRGAKITESPSKFYSFQWRNGKITRIKS